MTEQPKLEFAEAMPADEEDIVFLEEGKALFAQITRGDITVRERMSRHVMKLPPDKQEIYFQKTALALKFKLERACHQANSVVVFPRK